jgi:hypothetical protein
MPLHAELAYCFVIAQAAAAFDVLHCNSALPALLIIFTSDLVIGVGGHDLQAEDLGGTFPVTVDELGQSGLWSAIKDVRHTLTSILLPCSMSDLPPKWLGPAPAPKCAQHDPPRCCIDIGAAAALA